MTRPRLRAARDTDAEGLIGLIRRCFDEYPGLVLDVGGEAPELLRIATWAGARGGAFWVAEADGGIVGSVGVIPSGDGVWEIRKLYVDAGYRRRGLGARLCRRCERRATEAGATSIELWSDTRFLDAHRLYRRLGFFDTGRRRDLGDRSQSTESHFRKRLPTASGTPSGDADDPLRCAPPSRREGDP